MKRYYVCKFPSEEGGHEVHKQGCCLIPAEGERLFLGFMNTSNLAVIAARNLFGVARPCSWCCDRVELAVRKKF